MQIAFAIIAAMTLVSGVAAMAMRNLVHCALALAVTFVGLAAMYLLLDAPFVGWAQILVYVGAVAILVVFAILLTRASEDVEAAAFSASWIVGLAVAVLVFASIFRAVRHSAISQRMPPDKPPIAIRELGNQLINQYVLPLETVGLLLTAAAIGAVIIAMKDKEIGPSPDKTEPEQAAKTDLPEPAQTHDGH